MSVAGVGNDRRVRSLLAAGLVLLLSGCATPPWPFNSKQAVFRAPEPPQVLSAHSTTKGLRPCPPQLIAQAQWLARNMARVRLGSSKLKVVSAVGDPAHAEAFGLTNGAMVEVLFYHTPETICRVNAAQNALTGGLMPLVFQDDRLLGYGPHYYRTFIAPMVREAGVTAKVEADEREMQGMPEARVNMSRGPALAPAPARTGRLVQEDLPPRDATPPAQIYAPPPVPQERNGYTAPMQNDYQSDIRPTLRPAGYSLQDTGVELGRGEPLR